MNNATDGPKDYKLERDWCYYLQFAILIIDVLILASSVKEFIEEFDRELSCYPDFDRRCSM